MIKFSTSTLALSMAAALALPSFAQAATINGITFTPGDTLVIGSVYEGSVGSGYAAPITAAGQELGGIGIVDAIKHNGVTVWSNGDNGSELTFTFGGYIAEAPVFYGSPAPIGVNFSGGWINFFADSSPDFTTAPVGTALANATDGTSWLNLVGASTGTTCVLAATDCTLQSFILGGSLLAIASGSGSGYLDVDMAGAGAANSYFDTNSQPNGSDLNLGSSFNSFSANGDFAASGSFDMRGTTVPEPASLALLSLGLLGLGASTRRRAK